MLQSTKSTSFNVASTTIYKTHFGIFELKNHTEL